MSWKDWFSGERSDGDSGKVEDVSLKIKADDDGNVTDILVSREDDKQTHDHIYNADEGQSGMVERVDWGSEDKDDKD